MRKTLLLFISCSLLTLLSCNDEKTAPVITSNDTIITWGDETIDTSESSQWCLSRSNSWIALTNYNERTQYYMEWEGGMSQGIKSNPRFRISTNGGSPISQSINELELKSDGINCTLTFTGENGQSGSITFPLTYQ